MDHFNYILFIDDQPASNYYHEYILKDCTFVKETGSFISARTALDYFQKIKQKEEAKQPDLIFLDINMPEFDGFEFLDKLQEIQLTNYPIIVMISTSLNPADKQKANQNPLVFEFINKPLTIEYLESLKSRLNTNPK